MRNHWLNNAKKKLVFKQIDELAMDVWGEDGTFGDFIGSLNPGQLDFLMRMKLTEFMGDSDELSFGFELIVK